MQRRVVNGSGGAHAMSMSDDQQSTGNKGANAGDVFTTDMLEAYWNEKPKVTENEITRDYNAMVRSAKTRASALLTSSTTTTSDSEVTLKGGVTETTKRFFDGVGLDDLEPRAALNLTSKVKKCVAASLSSRPLKAANGQPVEWDDLSLKEQMKHAVMATAAKKGDINLSPEYVRAQVDKAVVWANELREHMPFFGLPTEKSSPEPFEFGGSLSQPSLQSAYSGPNEMVTSWFVLELVTADSWYMTLALPLRRSDNLAGEVYEQIIFNPTMLDRVPLLGTSSFATHRSAVRRVMQVRYGKSAEMEFSFSRTERGRMFWAANHIQIRNALMSTMNFAIATTIMGSKISSNAKVDNGGRGPHYRGGEPQNANRTRAELETALKNDLAAIDRINKIVNPLARMAEYALTRINQQSSQFAGGENVNITSEELVMATPLGARMAIDHSNAHNDPRVTGRARNDKFEPKVDGVRTGPGGCKSVESRTFHGHGGDLVDPQYSVYNLGQFTWLPGGADWMDTLLAGPIGAYAGAPSLDANVASAASAAAASAGVAGTRVPFTGHFRYRTESCAMDIWKADDDSWWTCSYAAAVYANQFYKSAGSDHSGRDANGRRKPRDILPVGLAVLLNATGVTAYTANNNLTPAGAPWYFKKGEPFEAALAVKYINAAERRWAAATNAMTPPSAVNTTQILSAHEFWGEALANKMAPYVLNALNNPATSREFTTACGSLKHVNGQGTAGTPVPAVGAAAGAAAGAPATATIASVVAWLRTVSLIDSAFFDLCLDFDIPLFMQHLIVTPFSQFEVGATIFFRSSNAELNGISGTGGGIGETLYGNPQYRLAFNANPGHYVAQFNIWFKPYVRNAQYVFIDVASFVRRHIRGDNGEFMTEKDAAAIAGDDAYASAMDAWDNDPDHMHTTYSIALPPQAELFKSDHFDISGNYHPSACTEKRGQTHYCTAPFYARWWKFRAVDSVDKQDATRSQAYGNSIVNRNVSQRRDEATGKLQRWRSKGPWLGQLEPGYFPSRMEATLRAAPQDSNITFVS